MGSPFSNRPEIAAEQLRRLRRLLDTILPGNAFYRRKFEGLDTNIASLEDFSARFPFTEKKELVADQLAHPPHGTNLTYGPERCTRMHQTSGTTSQPLRWFDAPEGWQWMVRNWQEVYRAAGVTGQDRVYFAFSFGPFIGFWLAFEAASQMNCLCIPGGGLDSVARLRAMANTGATVLCCTPSYAVRLAEVAVAEGIDLAQFPIRRIIVAGEAGGSISATRQRLEQMWPRTKVFDHHGMTETGPVTYECPNHPGLLHVMENAFVAEVISPAGKPSAPGESGELVLTTLGREASPVVRYRTGDVVRPVYFDREPCACGRYAMGLQGGILSRTDDMIVIRGVNVYPSAVEDVVRKFPEIAEFEVCVEKSASLAEMQVRIEPQPDCGDVQALPPRVQAALHASFNLRVPVSLAPVGALPRFEMKARRWKIGFESGGKVS